MSEMEEKKKEVMAYVNTHPGVRILLSIALVIIIAYLCYLLGTKTGKFIYNLNH